MSCRVCCVGVTEIVSVRFPVLLLSCFPVSMVVALPRLAKASIRSTA